MDIWQKVADEKHIFNCPKWVKIVNEVFGFHEGVDGKKLNIDQKIYDEFLVEKSQELMALMLVREPVGIV